MKSSMPLDANLVVDGELSIDQVNDTLTDLFDQAHAQLEALKETLNELEEMGQKAATEVDQLVNS